MQPIKNTLPPIAILAGGLATRLGSLVARTPKALLEVAGRPFLAWQLELLARGGVTDVVLCLGHQSNCIQEEIPRFVPLGMRVRYSVDGDRLLGTGGAIRKALGELGDVFFVMYGDSYLRCKYGAVADSFSVARATTGVTGLMTVYENRDRFDRSNVEFEHGKILRYSKSQRTERMHYIDWGLGVLTADAFKQFATQQTFDLADVYASLVQQGSLMGYQVFERFYEIGSREGLDELSRLLACAPSRD
jgi:NDP-sugar pyrophosphorylase family protein